MNAAGLILLAMLSGLQGIPARTHLVIVVGIGGSPEYTEEFHGLAVRLAESAVERHGLNQSDIHYLGERSDLSEVLGGDRSTKENVEQTLARLAATTGLNDRILIVLMGHGSFGDGESRFNLPGPDLTAAALGVALDAFGDRQLALVNCASSSGGFIQELSRPQRVIVTSTRSGRERNETIFAQYFVRAFEDDGSDLDKDRRVSLTEAFRYARRLTTDDYEQGKRMLSEHALLDDNGDGEGSDELDLEAGDGLVARAFFLGADPGAQAAADSLRDTDPVLAGLYEKRLVLQNRIEALRAQKNAMDPEAYEKELEQLLLELARTNQEIRKRGGGDA